MARYNTTDFVAATNNAVKNEMGGNADGLVLSEDLANIVEFGTSINALDEDSFKHWSEALAIGVYNFVIARNIEEKTFDFYKSSHEFGGALQRLMASGLLSSQESHVRNLNYEHGSYFDGKFYGVPIDGKVYLSEDAKKVVNSIPDEYYKSMFTSADEYNRIMTLIATNVENSIVNQMNALSKRLLMGVVVDALKDGRVIPLVTEFNKSMGEPKQITVEGELVDNPNFKEYDDILKDRKLFAYFSDFVKMTIDRVVDYMADPNTKYNDGTVVTWSPRTYIRTVLISEFDKAIKYIGNPIEFNKTADIKAETVGAWQSTSKQLLPTLNTTSKIKIWGETEEDDDITYNKVVGIVYDKDCAGIEKILNKTGVERVGSELFTNYHHHTVDRYYVDSRLGAVAFTLD